MRYFDNGEYKEIDQKVFLVLYNENYNLKLFDCGVEDYNNFLIYDAKKYMDLGISSVHLLVENRTDFVLGYIALLSDSFLLDVNEKEKLCLDVPYNSVPALKIGKLATHKDRKEHHYGCYLLWQALGFAEELLQNAVACRFITVDTDIEYDGRTPEFYEKNGFIKNEHVSYKKRTKNVSMRYDIFS